MLTNWTEQMEYVNEEDIYLVINRALREILKNTEYPVDKEMLALKERYFYQRKNMQLPSLFDKPWPTLQEIINMQDFCTALEAYRLSVDPYNDDAPELSEYNARLLRRGLEIFSPHISDENRIMINILERATQSCLPEFRNQYILEQYKERAKLIYGLKKQRKKVPVKDCERLALMFFTDIQNDQELKEIGICTEKMELYINAVNIVDCLPKEKYNRTSKFQLKSQLYYAISRCALVLDKPDTRRAKAAYNEYVRFKKAADNVLTHASNPDIQNAIRQKRMREEWLYK